MHIYARKLIVYLLLFCQIQMPVLARVSTDARAKHDETLTKTPAVINATAPVATAQPRSLQTPWETSHGRVTVGKPKIWRFDRVNSTLDGLLRDVDSVTLAKLEDMNPSESNQTVIDFLTTSLNIKGGFNQSTGAINALEMERVNAQRPTELQRLQSFNEMQQLAAQRRLEVYRQLIATRDRRAKLDPQSATFPDDKKALDATVTALETELTEIEKIAKETPPSVSTIDPKQFKETPIPEINSPITPVFNAADLKAKLLENLKATLPATKRLDNFITLLQERLKRELSISFDDVSRSKKEVFLIQFDVGIYPHEEAANHVLRIEFELEEAGRETPLAYDLYPGASSYNMTEFWGKSRGTGIAGAATFLSGFGLSGEYKRQRDQVRSAITQNVYTAGFGAGTPTFGWYFGTNPFEKLISPGTRTAYAVVLLDKELLEQKQQRQQQRRELRELRLKPRLKWLRRTEDKGCPAEDFSDLALPVPEPTMRLNRLAYQTKYSPPDSQGQTGNSGQTKPPEFGTVQLTFDEPIDPNLVITVNGAVLPRLRDVRGRAVARASATTDAANPGPKASTFGLLEIDVDTDSHWFVLGSKSVSLKLAKTLVGNESFPRIRLLQSGDGGSELRTMLSGSGTAQEARINNWQFRVTDTLPTSVFVPMFSTVEAIDDLEAWLDPRNPSPEIKIVRKLAPSSSAPLDEYTQVVLIRRNSDFQIPLDCSGYQPLSCSVPRLSPPINFNNGDFSVVLERASISDQKGVRLGFTGRAWLPPTPPPILTSDYNIEQVREATGRLMGWRLSLQAENLEANDEVEGFDVLNVPANRAHLSKTNTSLQFGNNPGYRLVNSQNNSGVYKGIEFWLPAHQVAAIVNSRLYLSRASAPGAARERLLDLPELASKVLPVVTEFNKNVNAEGYNLRGANLELIERIELRGCSEACPQAQRNCPAACEAIRPGVSSTVIGFAPPTQVSGVFPVFLHLRGGVVVEAAKDNGDTWAVQLEKVPEEKMKKKEKSTVSSLSTSPSPTPTPTLQPSTTVTEQKDSGRSQVLPQRRIVPPAAQEKERSRWKQTTIQ